jgi:hypothetical protein
VKVANRTRAGIATELSDLGAARTTWRSDTDLLPEILDAGFDGV